MKPRWNQIFSKAKFLKKVDKSLINHRNKHYDTVEYIDCHLHFKLRGKAMTSKVLKKVTIKLKLLILVWKLGEITVFYAVEKCNSCV